MNNEIMKELQEIEEMVAEARQHDEYKEKCFYVREGMLKLTGDVKKAILLSSLIGWTEHWLRTDNQVYEEIQEAAAAGDLKTIKELKKQIRQGWFYMKYETMAKELLNIISKSTAERYCNEFEKKGFILSKDSKSTNRTKWYKANIDKIREELNKLGYDLDYFKKQKAANSPISQNGKSQNTGVSGDESPKPQKNRISQNGKWISQDGKHLSYNTSFNKKQQQQDNVVVVVNQIIDQFEKTFSVKITTKQAKELLELSKKHKKDVFQAIKRTKIYFEQTGKERKNPYGAVHYEITTGWDLPEEPTAPAGQVTPAGPAYVTIEDSYLASGFVVGNSYLDELLEFDPAKSELEGVAK